MGTCLSDARTNCLLSPQKLLQQVTHGNGIITAADLSVQRKKAIKIKGMYPLAYFLQYRVIMREASTQHGQIYEKRRGSQHVQALPCCCSMLFNWME
jgi:hypothetical protein